MERYRRETGRAHHHGDLGAVESRLKHLMPMYDYKCLECGKESLVVLTLKEHERGEATCPACGSKKMQQLYTSFIAHTTKKS